METKRKIVLTKHRHAWARAINWTIWWTLCVHDGTKSNDAKNVVHTHHLIRMDQDCITLVIGYTRRGQFYGIFVGFRS